MDPSRAAARTPAVRGVSRPGHPAVSGAFIGAIGGTAFVAVNAPSLPAPWPLVSFVSGASALAAWGWTVLLARRVLPAAPRPGRSAGLVYLAGLAGMVAIMFAGARLLSALDRAAVLPAVVVLAVGVHFLPYARAFGAPVFFRLGAALAGLGILGVVSGLLLAPVAASGSAVAAGLVLLLGIAADARTPARRRPRR